MRSRIREKGLNQRPGTKVKSGTEVESGIRSTIRDQDKIKD